MNYSHLYVDSFWTNSQILDVKTRSNVLKTKLSVGGPLGVSAMAMPLTGEIFGARYDIYGDAREGIGFKSYAEVGFGLLAATNGEVPLFSKLGLVTSYSWNSDFDGWRIGLEGDL